MEAGLAGWGVVRIPWAEVPRWRKAPGNVSGLTPASHLKLADEQTVVACAAMLNACERNGWAPTDFSAWGVLAAPTYIGRNRLAPAFRRFQKSGPRSVSPLIIPTMSNHSVAASLCLILRSHGPNIGVAGSTHLVDELLVNAITLCDGQQAPGYWAVMTGWTPEAIPDDDGNSTTPAVAVGVALAIVPGAAAGVLRLPSIPLTPNPSPTAGRGEKLQGSVFELADYLDRADPGATWHCPIVGGGSLKVVKSVAQSMRKAG
jgi:hypothetical protein